MKLQTAKKQPILTYEKVELAGFFILKPAAFPPLVGLFRHM